MGGNGWEFLELSSLFVAFFLSKRCATGHLGAETPQRDFLTWKFCPRGPLRENKHPIWAETGWGTKTVSCFDLKILASSVFFFGKICFCLRNSNKYFGISTFRERFSDKKLFQVLVAKSEVDGCFFRVSLSFHGEKWRRMHPSKTIVSFTIGPFEYGSKGNARWAPSRSL